MELDSYYMQIDISKVAFELAEDRFTELIQSGKIKNSLFLKQDMQWLGRST